MDSRLRGNYGIFFNDVIISRLNDSAFLVRTEAGNVIEQQRLNR